MAEHEVTLINQNDGTVEGHKTGCKDIKRNKRRHADEPWDLTVENKVEAWLNYNSDFIGECYDHDNCKEAEGECVNAYPIRWLPCANSVPNV